MGLTGPRGAGFALVLTIGALGAACGGSGDGGDQGELATTTTGGPIVGDELELSAACTKTESGVELTVPYPASWQTNSGDVLPLCSVFDPESISIPPDSEVPLDLAVVLRVERAPLERIQDAMGAAAESSMNTTVAGRPAVRQELVSTGEGLIDRGVRFVRYLVDFGDATLVATTQQVEGNDFDRSVKVLDAMMRALEVRSGG